MSQWTLKGGRMYVNTDLEALHGAYWHNNRWRDGRR